MEMQQSVSGCSSYQADPLIETHRCLTALMHKAIKFKLSQGSMQK